MAAHTPKSNATDIDQMEEASQVLAQYLELFSYDCHQFKFYLNANSVVDWFGRSVRGPVKIHDYLSKEIGSQYEHIEFEKAESCGPIEFKPTHMKTKIASTMEMDYIHPRNRVTGITSLKSYAESDMEEDDDDVPGHKTPEQQKLNVTVIEGLTPPVSTRKATQGGCGDQAAAAEDDEEVVSATASEGDNNVEDDDDNDALMPSRAKRFKRTHPIKPFSYLRRLPTGRMPVKSEDEDSSSSSSDAEEFANKIKIKKNLVYAPPPLRYLEATGVLRRRRRGAAAAPSAATSTPPDASSSWDRAVRLRISYRRRVHDADRRVEFALVIYEPLAAAKAPMRRNLCAEFSRTLAAAADDHDADEHIVDDEDVRDEQEQPALVLNAEQTTVVSVATVATPNTDEIAAALETAAFTIVPMRTPTKTLQTPPATPKRRPRLPASGTKRFNLSSTSGAAGTTTTTTPATPKRSAARSLRL